MTPPLSGMLQALAKHKVRFIVVGGVAGAVHGSARVTYDLDIVYDRDSENIQRLVEALTPLSPYLRDVPPGLPFVFDVQTLTAGLNFTLSTSLGALDLFGEIAGGGTYGKLLPHTVSIELYGVKCLCVDIETLIRLKKAAGRPRDIETIGELSAIIASKQPNKGG
jgi:hypothetical protein